MLSFLPSWLRGVFAFILVITNTFFWLPFLLLGTFLKLVLPISIIRKSMTLLLIAIANSWVACNSAILSLTQRINWQISGVEALKKDDWYFVNCNHQSWTDIPVVQKVLNRKVPMLKFFLKQELIWVPIMGVCWWALDFPFMKRYSNEYLKKHPEMKGKDLETTRKACGKFKTTPVAVFNFLEGTRFTPAKHAKQQSPYKNLLNPKFGGAAFVMGSMGEQMHTMLDITIYYPEGPHGVWGLLTGKIQTIVVDVKKVAIPSALRGKDYSQDPEFKAAFQVWIKNIWQEKDELIEQLKVNAAKSNAVSMASGLNQLHQ
ncbi:acyltransferase [Alkalimarinus alittae]|uniref:Acyltransferase n=1 Tax=Alkalimarinus alittae TaxID=2961619 RepID=A0ABY6MZR5_9ALTE|nr:acyltransferase [Alkalimarinus alittae]UZE95343.1 acyltransferase [Alkalimarinus alittae]